MKKIKYFIMILGIIAIILIFSLLGYKVTQKDNEVIDDLSKIEVPNSINNIGYEEFFGISNCISQYLDILNKKNSSYYRTDENGKNMLVVTSSQVKENIIALKKLSFPGNISLQAYKIFDLSSICF